MRQKKQGFKHVKSGQKSPPTVAVNASPQRKSRNLQKAYLTEGANAGNSISSKGVTSGSGNVRQNISFESRSGNKIANQSGKKTAGNGNNQQYFN